MHVGRKLYLLFINIQQNSENAHAMGGSDINHYHDIVHVSPLIRLFITLYQHVFEAGAKLSLSGSEWDKKQGLAMQFYFIALLRLSTTNTLSVS